MARVHAAWTSLAAHVINLDLPAVTTMPMLYVCAVIFGVADAFSPGPAGDHPCGRRARQDPAANALSQGTNQLMVMVGPAAAGMLVAVLGTTGSNPSQAGIGAALLVDALSFVVSLATLALMRRRYAGCVERRGPARCAQDRPAFRGIGRVCNSWFSCDGRQPAHRRAAKRGIADDRVHAASGGSGRVWHAPVGDGRRSPPRDGRGGGPAQARAGTLRDVRAWSRR